MKHAQSAFLRLRAFIVLSFFLLSAAAESAQITFIEGYTGTISTTGSGGGFNQVT
jgi:hypothetical protein